MEKTGSRLIDHGRRGVMGAMAAGAAAFVLLGPRGSRESAGGRVVLDYWEKWTGHEGAAMRRVVEEFNASQSRILVRYLSMSGIDQKALVAIAGGDPPDMVGLWNYSIPVFSEAAALTRLDDLAPAAGVKLEDYAAGVRPIMTHRGSMWGVINTGGTLALYYNRRLFREVGLDPDRPPRTISEMVEMGRRLTVKEPGGGLVRAGFMHNEPGWWTWVWGYHFGGSMWDESSERSTVDSAAFGRAYGWVQSSIRELGLTEATRFQESFGNYDSPQNAFLARKVGMILQGPWLANVIKAYAPELEYGVAPFPVDDGLYREGEPIACIDTDVLVIPRGVRHPEASMEFLAYTQRQEVVEYLATVHAKGSPMARVSDSFVANHPNRGVAVHNALAASPRGFLCPRSRVWTQLKAEFDAGAVRIRRLEAPADEVLAQVRERSQAVLDVARRARERREAASGGAASGGAASAEAASGARGAAS